MQQLIGGRVNHLDDVITDGVSVLFKESLVVKKNNIKFLNTFRKDELQVACVPLVL